MIKSMLSKRKLMEIWDSTTREWPDRKNEIIDMLCKEEYGFLPPEPEKISWEVLEEDKEFCAGKVTLKKILLNAVIENRSFSFPIYTSIPNTEQRHPFFVHINFSNNVPDEYMPIEEICDYGFAVLSFCYEDVTSDDNDFSAGLADIIYHKKDRRKNDSGKIAMWSWAASRVMDYAQTLSDLDFTKAAVVGHSRLGKTALLTGALDERFSCVISNNSGCSGAAISREKQGETIRDIYTAFPYWFCENYKEYMDNEFALPFDQHFLLAVIAPRKVYISSAKEDLWADPASEFLACAAASEVYEKLGLEGLVCPDRLPIPGDVFCDGNIGYHLRSGTHYLSREDWLHFIEFLKK